MKPVIIQVIWVRKLTASAIFDYPFKISHTVEKSLLRLNLITLQNNFNANDHTHRYINEIFEV